MSFGALDIKMKFVPITNATRIKGVLKEFRPAGMSVEELGVYGRFLLAEER